MWANFFEVFVFCLWFRQHFKRFPFHHCYNQYSCLSIRCYTATFCRSQELLNVCSYSLYLVSVNSAVSPRFERRRYDRMKVLLFKKGNWAEILRHDIRVGLKTIDVVYKNLKHAWTVIQALLGVQRLVFFPSLQFRWDSMVSMNYIWLWWCCAFSCRIYEVSFILLSWDSGLSLTRSRIPR